MLYYKCITLNAGKEGKSEKEVIFIFSSFY